MQKEITYLITFLAILGLLSGCHSSGPKGPADLSDAFDIEPVTLAVLYFESDNEELRNLALDMLIIEFSQMQEFTVVEREKLDKILDEMGMSASDLVDESTRVRIGNALGAHLMCFGSISSSATLGYLTRVETGENFGGVVEQGKVELKTIKSFAEQMKAGLREEKSNRIIREISATMCFYRGEAHEDAGRTQDACQQYNRAVEIYPDHQKAKEAVKRLGCQG
jgi:hypothetical protein